MNLNAFTSIKELKHAIDQKQITPQEVVAFYLDRLNALDGKIGATLSIFDKQSVLKETQEGGMLQGIPGIIKNNICIKDCCKIRKASNIYRAYHRCWSHKVG